MSPKPPTPPLSQTLCMISVHVIIILQIWRSCIPACSEYIHVKYQCNIVQKCILCECHAMQWDWCRRMKGHYTNNHGGGGGNSHSPHPLLCLYLISYIISRFVVTDSNFILQFLYSTVTLVQLKYQNLHSVCVGGGGRKQRKKDKRDERVSAGSWR